MGPQQQVFNQPHQQKLAMIPSSPQLRQHQFPPQQGTGYSQPMNPHLQQQMRMPLHAPQSLVPVNNIQS